MDLACQESLAPELRGVSFQPNRFLDSGTSRLELQFLDDDDISRPVCEDTPHADWTPKVLTYLLTYVRTYVLT